MLRKFFFFLKTLPSSNLHSFHNQLTFSATPHGSNHPSHILNPRIYTHLLQTCLQKCKQVKTHNLFDEIPQRLSQFSTTNKIIHAQSLKLGFWSKGGLGNVIVDLYAKCADVEYAERAFKQLEYKDILAWNSILSMHSKQGFPHMVVKYFGLLLNSGVWPNEFTFAIVLSSCARFDMVECGRQVHCNVVKMGLESISYCEGALIGMYAKCNLLTDARSIFDGAVELDKVSWTSMIGGYIKVGLPEEAVQVFQEMEKAGQEPDQVAFVTVINAYVDLGRLDNASDLFSRMPNRNVVAWNLMISGHAKGGYGVEAIKFFQNMRKGSIKSTRSTLGSVLSAIASLAALDFGLLVHAEALKLGLHSNVYVGSSLVSMYAKCGKMEAAKKVFNTVDEQNVVLWNAMLGGYVQNGHAYEVIELFFNMKSCGFYPDDFTYSSILSACACLKYLDLGRQLHSFIIKNKFASNLFVGNALVDMYAKSGALEDARQQFELIRNRDNVSWNVIIVGYVQEEDEIEAFHLFQRMNLLGILPDEVSLASILSACASVRGLEQGKQVHCLSVKSGQETKLYSGSSLIDMYAKCGAIDSAHKILACMPERSVVSMNALIAGYAQINLERAVNLFREMLVEGINSTEITFASLLDACHEQQKLNLGRQIHCLILKMGLQLDDEFLGVSLLGMYMKSLRTTDASILFSEFSNPKSAVVWTAMISGLSQNDCSVGALQLYKEMRSCNVLPDQAAFVSALRACAVVSSIKDGRETHSLIFHTGFDSDEVTKAEEFIDKLNFEPDAKVWATMLGACRIHGDDIRGQQAAEKLIELEPQNSSPYVLLSNIYAASGNWDEVNTLRREMREKGVKKLPGCSWIVVGQETNMFVAGDKSHHSASEIDAVLKDLTLLMRENDYFAQLDCFGNDEE
ncbi:hypothetical protein OIU77_019740 [Salix suchowensis]|uniref:Chlororespiratory reduction 21 n=1 Tax=Salix suchowensis TaxID=1278906 RepID=A0ABQ9CH94_9ROSI|nr:hypothetical protein OIU77_019740 [Salix suchowensis]KAJ6399051.1 hypothetical protein OIU77_019740 [Salix suchowensis]